ncbi:MAG: 30S ribosomal protein S16 [Candidatus Zixiibacteriota bacterium]|nr:MAG: 30S ribosomal protein S16 [candidate division Zixibacteria bacterium]
MRLGRKGQPFYRIVAVDARKRRDGAYIDKIGHYNPMARPAELVMDDDKAMKWLRTGAIPTDTVRSLLSRRGVMLRLSLEKKGLSAEEIDARVGQHRLDREARLRERDHVAQPAVIASPEPEPETETAAAPAEEEKSAEEEPSATPTEGA